MRECGTGYLAGGFPLLADADRPGPRFPLGMAPKEDHGLSS